MFLILSYISILFVLYLVAKLVMEIRRSFEILESSSARTAKDRLFVEFGCAVLSAPIYQVYVDGRPAYSLSEIQVVALSFEHPMPLDVSLKILTEFFPLHINGKEYRFKKRQSMRPDFIRDIEKIENVEKEYFDTK